MSKTLDKAIQDHYNRQSPPAEVMDRLLGMQQFSQPQTINQRQRTTLISRSRQWKPWLLTIAASLMMAIATWAWLGAGAKSSTAINANDVAISVLTYHEYNRSPDFTAAHTLKISHLNKVMDRLDFQLRLPPEIGEQRLRLHSARYCQVAGHIAAHLYLRDENDQRHSLYVARSTDQLTSLAPYQTQLDNHQVSLWQDGTLFYALVQGQ